MIHPEPDPDQTFLDQPFHAARARGATLREERQQDRSMGVGRIVVVDRVRERVGRALIALGAAIAPPTATPGSSVRRRSTVSR